MPFGFHARMHSLFCEQRLIFFAREKPDIPVPRIYEEFGRELKTLKEKIRRFHGIYQRSLDYLPRQPAISSDILRSFSDEEADRVFDALKREGHNAGDILLLRTHNSTEKAYAECKQQMYERQLLLHALKDVQKMQERLHNYTREQTTQENLGDNPVECKENRTVASHLINVIAEIGNGNCVFPEKEPKENSAQTDEEKKKRMLAWQKFHYDSIRDCERLRDSKGNLILSMPLMRSLALLHLHFNDLTHSAMNAECIALAEQSVEQLLLLARSDLDLADCQPLQNLSETLRAGDEPAAEDFQQYPAMLEQLPALPKLILTLLHKDIAAAHLQPKKDKQHNREDLAEQYSKGTDIVTDTERAVLMRELIEYLADYVEALAEPDPSALLRAGETEENDGFKIRNAFRIYKLLRENARKYLFQSGVNFIYLTGSDHGVKHLIQGDVRFSTKIAEQLKWSARDRVCLRQIAVDHDLGYTHTAMQRFSMHEDKGIPLNNGYYGLTKDHPLYSSACFEAHRPEYEEYFGKQGAHNIGLSILDHSEVKGHLREKDPAKRIQALFCRIDCMAVSADLKNAPALMDDKVLIAMSKAFEAADYLKDIDRRMQELWKENQVESAEYDWLVTVQKSLRKIAWKVKQYLLVVGNTIYDTTVFQQAYHRAMDENYDPFNPTFPTQRDFGSNAIRFAGLDVRSTSERDHLTVRLGLQRLFFEVADYFGEKQGPDFATSAIKKLLEAFGGSISDPSKVIEALTLLLSKREAFHTKDSEKSVGCGIEYKQHHATHVHFEFDMPELGASSPLATRMLHLVFSLETMRKVMTMDFDAEKLSEIFVRAAQNIANSDMLIRILEKNDLNGATVSFLDQHFSLPE